MNHGGAENGNLKATYDQLNEHGIPRDQIRPAIEQAIALGFVRRTSARVMRVAMTYRLTYYGTISDAVAVTATDDWKRLDEQSVKAAKQKSRGTRNSAGT